MRTKVLYVAAKRSIYDAFYMSVHQFVESLNDIDC
jgi:hypothetical protein